MAMEPVKSNPSVDWLRTLVPRLTDLVQKGAWDWVAAQSLGLSYNQWQRILRWGKTHMLAREEHISYHEAEAKVDPNGSWPRPRYADSEFLDMCAYLVQEVRRAKGKARATAETYVYADDPYRWLRSGPGRSRPDRPGWTEEALAPVQEQEKLQIEVVDYRVAAAPLAPVKDEDEGTD